MNNQTTPGKKRLKPDPVDNSTKSDDKQRNIPRLIEMCEFLTYNKENFVSEIKFDDCFRLMILESELTKTLESCLFSGNYDPNGTIQDRLLHETIKKNDQPLFMKLIHHGLVEKSICKHETPPLFELIAQNRLDWIELLHKAGVSFSDQTTKSGMPLLHFALKQRGVTKELLKKLLFYGAELSAKNSCNLTPLHYLLSNQITMPNERKEQFVKLFLKFGADANSRTKFASETPLHTAVKNKNPQAVELLLLYGANVNLKNSRNDTAFQVVAQNTVIWTRHDVKDEIFRFFVKHVNLMKLQGKRVDKQITRHHDVFSHYEVSKIVNKTKKTQERNALAILLWNENKLAKFYSTGEFNVSKVIVDEPFKYWERNLKFRIKKARQRNVLLSKCETSVSRCLQLPEEIVKEVLQFLTTTDLRSLYAACCPASFMEKLEIEEVNLTKAPSDETGGEIDDDDNEENSENGNDDSSEEEEEDDDDDDSSLDDSDEEASEDCGEESSENVDAMSEEEMLRSSN